MRPSARLLPGNRLHLSHGPSDLIIWAEGDQEAAYLAARRRFETVISEIVDELPLLRQMLSPISMMPQGTIARRMHNACQPFASSGYLTRMAAVAGSVADEILAAMLDHAPLSRAYVNNGGDIALYLAPGTSFRTAIQAHDGADLGHIQITANDGVGGVATSGRHGRSLSFGIADSVTVLARSAALADVAATLIANAVDLPDHPAIRRRPACALDDDSDLGTLPVVVGRDTLDPQDVARALNAGQNRAFKLQSQGHIAAAGLFLQGEAVTTGDLLLATSMDQHHVQA